MKHKFKLIKDSDDKFFYRLVKQPCKNVLTQADRDGQNLWL